MSYIGFSHVGLFHSETETDLNCDYMSQIDLCTELGGGLSVEVTQLLRTHKELTEMPPMAWYK